MGLGNIGDYMNENWHGGEIKGDFFSVPNNDENGNEIVDIPVSETEVKVESKPKSMAWNWRHTVKKDLMKGVSKRDILSKYQDVMKRFGVEEEINAFIDKYEGLLGYFIVDVSDFDEKFGYYDIPEYMRASNLYAIGSAELREVISRTLVSENDGTIDGFFSADDNVNEEVKYIDEKTGLPVIDSVEDGILDDGDERLAGIAQIFLNRKWMSFSEFESFCNMNGKIDFLVSIVRKHLHPAEAISVDGNYADDAKDYEVEDIDLVADSIENNDSAEVSGVSELKTDDVIASDESSIGMQKDLEVEDGIHGDFEKKDNFSFNKKFDLFEEVDPGDENANSDFDISDVKNLYVGDDDLTENRSAKTDVNYDTRKEDIEISDKYDWTF